MVLSEGMSERTLKYLPTSDSGLRVLIVERADGRFAYRKQWVEEDGSEIAGVDAGIYDSPETAESEARRRIPELANKISN